MPVIFGHEVKASTLWIAGGLVAVGVAGILYIRSQGQAPEVAAAAPPDTGGGGGGGGGQVPVAVPAPTDQQAANYNTALQDIQLQAARFGLQQQQEQAREQKAQFDLGYALNQAYNQAQASIYGSQAQLQEAQNAALASQAGLEGSENAALQKQVEKTGASCPGNASLRWNPQQGWYCREKTSGGILGIPLGQIVNAIGNFVGGVQAGAGQAGQTVAIAAGQAGGAAIRAQAGVPAFGNYAPGYGQQTQQSQLPNFGYPGYGSQF